MGANGFERAAELFEELGRLPPAERAAAMARCEREGAAVLEQLRRMLAGAERPCAALERPARAALPAAIGGFRILRLLGEGGMGRVFEAEQQSPRRRVALKVIRGAFAAPEVLRRFELEAQVLGRLKHPGLATVYEAGSAVVQGERVPYLAMELVEGEPLDAYLARARPALNARVELVALLCDAVHHAHQKSVVHRDLKPSNVLVESSGRPRVLDFGIARITGADLEATTQHTNPGAVLGTLPYMSPEQIAGDSAEVDVRSDVYALGVLLYEVLGGRRPFTLGGKTLAEAARIVTLEDPTRLGALDPRLRGDLETIAAKALSKEKERRYASAAELAEDLRRTLRDEPIAARPVTTLYQLLKFARRNRRFVGALGFALLSLVGGLCASLVLAVRERGQRALAEEHALALELQLYRQGIAEAQRELRTGNRDRARELAAALPRRFAGWELAHLEDVLADGARLLTGHARHVYRLRTDRSGSLLTSSSEDGSVHLWDVESGIRTHTIDPAGQPRRFDLSPDGRAVFVLSWDSPASTMTASLWEDGRLVRAVPHRAERMGWGECAFDPRGELVLWGWNDGVLRAWDARTGRERYAVRVHATDVRTLAIDSRGDTLVTGGNAGDCTIQLLDLGSGTIRHAFPAQESAVAELAFLGDSSLILSRTEGGVLRLWDGYGGELRARLDLSESVTCIASSSDGSCLYAGTDSGRISVVDVESTRIAAVLDARLPVTCLALLAEQQTLAAGAKDGRITFLDADTGQVRGAFAPPVARGGVVTALQPVAGGGLAAGHMGGALRILPATAMPFEVLADHDWYVYGTAFARGGSAIVGGSWDRTLRLWDAATLAPVSVVSLPDRVVALAVLAEERVLVALMTGQTLAIDLADGSTAWSRQWHGWDGSGAAVCASPDGSRALVVDPNEFVARVLDGRDGTVLAEHAWPAWTRAAAWDPRDRWIAGGSTDLLTLFDPRTLEPRHTTRLEGTPQRLAVSPDARLIAVGSREGSIEVVDVEEGKPRARLAAGHGIVYALAFHPDGARLASGTEDGSVSLWETRTWTRICDLEPHALTAAEPVYRYVFELAFSPDGTQLVSASGDHTLRVWRADPSPTDPDRFREDPAARQAPPGERLKR